MGKKPAIGGSSVLRRAHWYVLDFGPHKIAVSSIGNVRFHKSKVDRKWWQPWRPRFVWQATVSSFMYAYDHHSKYVLNDPCSIAFDTEEEADSALRDAKDLWLLITDQI